MSNDMSKAQAAYNKSGAVYDRAIAPAQAAFNKAREDFEVAEIAYERATAPARAAYRAAIDKAQSTTKE